MRELAALYGDKLVVAFGRDHVREITESYGFKNVITGCEYHAQFPLSYPDIKPLPKSTRVGADLCDVSAILCIMVRSKYLRR
jgi:hypothetical protein